MRLPDASLSPSAGSRRFQNDSCGQFACAVCHEMKKQPCLFISWPVFPVFSPKHCHEMKNRPCIFISWRVFPAISLKYSHEMKKSLYFFHFMATRVGQFDSSLPLSPFAPVLDYVHSLIRLPVKRHLTRQGLGGGCRRGLCQMTGLQRGSFDMTLALTRLYPLLV